MNKKIKTFSNNIHEQIQDLVPLNVIEEVRKKIGNMSPIVEITTTCNLSCKYCFAARNNEAIMDRITVEKIILQTVEINGNEEETKFIWHGGEPLIAGLDFFKHIVSVQNDLKRLGYRTVNAVQTNGTLLEGKWIDFCLENKFGVGSSIDGLPDLHNKRRRTRSDMDTYDLVVKNIVNARKKGLKMGVICVIDQTSLPFIEDIYYNFKDLDIPFTMSPLTPNPGREMSLTPLTPDQYKEALIRLFDVWYNDATPLVQVNPPHSVLTGVIYGGLPLYCSADDSCFSKFISYLPDGTVYPCNRFAGYEEYYLGNIQNETLSEILNKEPRKKLLNRNKKTLEPCNTCSSGDMCRGGCAYHAFAFYGDHMKPDYYCQAFFSAFSYYRTKFNEALNSALYDQKEKTHATH